MFSKRNNKKSNRTFLSFLIMGPSLAGKTALVQRIANNYYENSLPSTIATDFSLKEVEIMKDKNKETIRVKVWDGPGQERFTSMIVNSLQNMEGVMLVYNVTEPSTFSDAQYLIDTTIKENKDIRTFPMVIVGSFIDLDGQRCVTREEGQKFADKYNKAYFEVSAKTGEGVMDAFYSLISSIYYSRNQLKNESLIVINKKYQFRNNKKVEEDNNQKSKTAVVTIKEEKKIISNHDKEKSTKDLKLLISQIENEKK